MPGQRASEEQRKRQILDAAYQVVVQKGLDGLTGRDVAQVAGLSSGLVFFHYGSIEALRLALLDELIGWLIGLDENAATDSSATDFLALMREEIGLQQTDHDKVGLFLQFWVLGMRFPEMRARLRQALDDYRALFREPAWRVSRRAWRRSPRTGARVAGRAGREHRGGLRVPGAARPGLVRRRAPAGRAGLVDASAIRWCQHSACRPVGCCDLTSEAGDLAALAKLIR